MYKNGIFPILLLALIWGSYYVTSKITVAGLSIFTAGFAIRFVCWILLTVMMAIKKELRLLLQVKHVWMILITIGILGFLLDWTAFIGLQMASASTGTALLKSDVLMVSLISIVVYKMRFTWQQWLFTILMLVGVLAVIGINPAEIELANWGNIFFLLSALFVSINAFVIKHVQHHSKNPVSDNVVAYYNNFVCMLFFLVASLGANNFGNLQLGLKSSSLTWIMLLTGVLQTLIYIVYYYDLRHFPVWFVKVFLLSMPIVSSIISFIFFGEKLKGYQYFGIVVIIAGAAGILLQQRKTESQKIS